MFRWLVLSFALPLPGGPVQRPYIQPAPVPDEWIAPDKAGHFVGSYLAHTTVYAALRTADVDRRPAQTGAMVTSLALGLSKELFDRHRGGPFSWKDIVWDIAGTAAAAGAVSVMDR